MNGPKIKNSIYDNLYGIGGEILTIFEESVDGALLRKSKSDSWYQKIIFPNGCELRFGKQGKWPLYLLARMPDGKSDFFQLNLSWIWEKNERYTWFLRQPMNNNMRAIVERHTAGECEFSQEYHDAIKIQKEETHSGDDSYLTHGLKFLENATWGELSHKIKALIIDAFAEGGHHIETHQTEDEKILDDPEKYVNTKRKERKNQAKFRENLLNSYNGKCTILNEGPLDVLDACHIEEHKESGNNQLSNGLIMRSDLHRLFDKRLLNINPDSFEIEIDSSLSNTRYYNLNGKQIRKTNKGTFPSKEFLQKRYIERDS